MVSVGLAAGATGGRKRKIRVAFVLVTSLDSLNQNQGA